MTTISMDEFFSAFLEGVNRGKKRAREPVIEPVTEPAVTQGQMLKMERNMQETVKRENEEMKREIQEIAKRDKEEMKREMQEIVKRGLEETFKRFFQNSSTQGAPADSNENPRTPYIFPDHQNRKSEEVEFQTYALEFVNKLHNIIFTKDDIKDENGGSVQIKLIDTSGSPIIHLSSMEIKIYVLPGDNEKWTEQEFIDKIVDKKEGRRGPLVKGKQNITLRNGVGTMDDFIFLDNSSWIPSKKVRLGARVLQSPSNMGQVIRIKDAITEPFAVLDHRGKISHLKKIQEGGKFHKALIENDIRTGSDWKQIYKTNRDKLKEILKGCSDSEWAAIARYASCDVEEDVNSNPSPPSQVAEAYNPATTVLAGKQTDCNRASSSLHNSAFQPEIVQNLPSHGPPITISDYSSANGFISNQNNNAPTNLDWSPDMSMLPDDNSAGFSYPYNQPHNQDQPTLDCTLSM